MADNRKFASVLAKRLKTDISASDTTFKLPDITWYTGSDGVAVTLASSDFGTVAYGVFEPNTARQEFFTWDPTTIANYATTGISILARGLPWSADYTTEASSRKWGHDGGTKVLLMTNAPAFYDQFTNKNNDETIAGTWTFTSTARPKYDTHPTFVADEELIDKKYADDLAIAGSPDGSTTVKGIFEEATVAEQGSAAATGGTGARLIVANANLVKTSSGAGDENKIAVLDASGTFDNGFIDKARTWGTVQSFTANNAQITTDADSANDAVRKSFMDSSIVTPHFGGSSDGAFAETAGTTTWDTATKTVYQFSSFSLTGTAALTIGSNLQNKPILVFIDGDFTVTSSAAPAITAAGRGGSGATGAVSLSAVNGTAGKGIQKVLSTGGLGGSASTDPATFSGPGGGGGASSVTAGSAGGNGSGGTGRVAGAAGGTGLLANATSSSPLTVRQWMNILSCGDGGGAGCGSSGGSIAGGNGGAGGGCIIFFVKGNINITSTFTVAGSNGSNGTNNGSNYYSGGGGGGGGGSIGIFYTGSVTANSATLTVSGGSGGTSTGSSGDGGAGGAGIGLVKQIDAKFFSALFNG